MKISAGWVHPMRWQRSRPFANQVSQIYRRHGSFWPTKAVMEATVEIVSKAYNEAIMRVPRDLRPERATRLLNGEAAFAMHVGCFVAHGRNIFALAPDLIALLERTGLEGVTAADIQLPFPAFYVSFGDGFPVSLPGPPNRIDGAYIELMPGTQTLQVFVTSRRTDDAGHWVFAPEAYYYAPLDMADPEATFADMVDKAVTRGEVKIDSETSRPVPDQVVLLADREVVLRDVSYLTAEETAAFNRDGMSSFRRALSLAVNAICFLTAYAGPAETVEAFPEEVPEEERIKLQGDLPGKARQKARSRMLEQGYMPVRVLGLPTAGAASDDEVSPTDAGSGRGKHWRRGHWRRQRYGQGLALVRLLWIRPVMVNSDREGNAPGHVYDLRGPASPQLG